MSLFSARTCFFPAGGTLSFVLPLLSLTSMQVLVTVFDPIQTTVALISASPSGNVSIKITKFWFLG